MTRVAYLFPGQGSQYSSMGRDLYEAHAVCREVFETADRVLEHEISKICFEGSEEQLALTENTQPAILAVSLAALRALEERGIRAVAAAGHSLGEYAALVAAGTLSAEEAIRTVRLRGRFMQEAVPVGEGAMAAVLGLSHESVESICGRAAGDGVVSSANINSPRQIVIAGSTEAVERACRLAREEGAKRVIPLSVSAPFHCALMRPATERLRPVLDALEFRDPSMPVFCNVDAAPVASAAAARDALVRQVASTVRWHETMEAMLASGIETFIEVGPGKVLAGLMRGIRRDVTVLAAGDAASVEAVAAEITVDA